MIEGPYAYRTIDICRFRPHEPRREHPLPDDPDEVVRRYRTYTGGDLWKLRNRVRDGGLPAGLHVAALRAPVDTLWLLAFDLWLSPDPAPPGFGQALWERFRFGDPVYLEYSDIVGTLESQRERRYLTGRKGFRFPGEDVYEGLFSPDDGYREAAEDVAAVFYPESEGDLELWFHRRVSYSNGMWDELEETGVLLSRRAPWGLEPETRLCLDAWGIGEGGDFRSLPNARELLLERYRSANGTDRLTLRAYAARSGQWDLLPALRRDTMATGPVGDLQVGLEDRLFEGRTGAVRSIILAHSLNRLLVFAPGPGLPPDGSAAVDILRTPLQSFAARIHRKSDSPTEYMVGTVVGDLDADRVQEAVDAETDEVLQGVWRSVGRFLEDERPDG
ncbi:hypothetical protein [Salininema proteolyticum]|uniref:Uncharacterized protein n=1 Tax=Salininema proteolyticum TaxID=1607685 RepID=A0ABV8TYH2_9ACTN